VPSKDSRQPNPADTPRDALWHVSSGSRRLFDAFGEILAARLLSFSPSFFLALELRAQRRRALLQHALYRGFANTSMSFRKPAVSPRFIAAIILSRTDFALAMTES
jgi:hypothetical protein